MGQHVHASNAWRCAKCSHLALAAKGPACTWYRSSSTLGWQLCSTAVVSTCPALSLRRRIAVAPQPGCAGGHVQGEHSHQMRERKQKGASSRACSQRASQGPATQHQAGAHRGRATPARGGSLPSPPHTRAEKGPQQWSSGMIIQTVPSSWQPPLLCYARRSYHPPLEAGPLLQTSVLQQRLWPLFTAVTIL